MFFECMEKGNVRIIGENLLPFNPRYSNLYKLVLPLQQLKKNSPTTPPLEGEGKKKKKKKSFRKRKRWEGM